MITFLVFLICSAVIVFAAAFYTCRLLLGLYPDRKVIAALGAGIISVCAWLVFHLLARSLIEVRAPSAGMGGLAWALEIVSYAIAVATASSCLFAGIMLGLKRSANPPGKKQA